jgi:esterase/lipase superfamily enzyme
MRQTATLLLITLLVCLSTPGSSSAQQNATTVSVFYATNRLYYPQEAPEERYSGERGEPGYGRCEVMFEPIPLVRDVAPNIPFYVPSESRTLQTVEALSPQLFRQQLQAAVVASGTGSIVVFVHGYNYSFERSCLMVTPLQRALGNNSTLLLLSWPADGNPASYIPDQVDVEWSVPFLADVIAELSYHFGAGHVDILAHSLGSRGVIYALERIRAERGGKAVIDQLVLLAPDFDAQTFAGFLPRLRTLAGRITLYASSNDAPLMVSRQINGYPRLGEAGDYLTVLTGMQTIDVSGIGRNEFLGHEYFYYQPLVSADLVELLTTGKTADERAGLTASSKNDIRYWEISGPENR